MTAETASAPAAPRAEIRPPATRLETALLVGVVLACAAAMSVNLADADLWGHVQYGRDTLNLGLQRTTSYSYTADGTTWTDHENLAEIVSALVADAGGFRGLLLLKAVFGVVVIGLMLSRAWRTGVPLIPAALTVLLVSINLAYNWAVRPQLFTYLCCALLLALFSWCFQGWEGGWRLPWPRSAAAMPEYSSRRMKALWLLPLLMIVWTNAHGGFAAGLCIITAYLGCRAFEALLLGGWEALGIIRRLGLMWLASVAATFINPYGIGLHLWMRRVVSVPQAEIGEWHPPVMFDMLTIPFWILLIVGGAALLLSRKPRDFTHLVVLAAILSQALSHQRHIPFVALLAGFWLPQHIASLLARFRGNAPEKSLEESWSGLKLWQKAGLAGGFAVAVLFLVGRLYTRLGDMPVEKHRFPVAALAYLAEQNPSGKLVVTYNWAQYAIAAVGPTNGERDGLRVAYDGRYNTCYPQEVQDMHFDFILGDLPGCRWRSPDAPPIDGGRVLEHLRPDFVLLDRRQPHSVSTMQEHADAWTLLYQDGLAQVWGRTDTYGNPRSPRFIAPEQRSISNAEQLGTVTWPALPPRAERAAAAAETRIAPNNS